MEVAVACVSVGHDARRRWLIAVPGRSLIAADRGEASIPIRDTKRPVEVDLARAFGVLTHVIDRLDDPDQAAYRVALRLLLRHDIDGVVLDPADDAFAGQAGRLIAEADRLLAWARERWDRIQPAGDEAVDEGEDAPF